MFQIIFSVITSVSVFAAPPITPTTIETNEEVAALVFHNMFRAAPNLQMELMCRQYVENGSAPNVESCLATIFRDVYPMTPRPPLHWYETAAKLAREHAYQKI